MTTFSLLAKIRARCARHRRWMLALALLLAVLVIKLAFFPGKPDVRYATAPVTRGELESTVLANGIIKAYRQVSVGAQVSGQIKTLNVTLGQLVHKGDLVAEIDPRTKQNDLLTAQAQLTSAEAQLASRQAALTKARLDLTRQQTMWAAEATSRADLDSARESYDSARADVRQLQAEIEQYRISVDTARLNLGYTRIVAPIDGIVVSVPVEQGQTVNAAQSTPTIIKLAQLDRMTVKAEISEGDVPRVKPGMPVYFTILGDPDHRYRSTLRSIDPGPESLSDDDSTTSSSSSTSSTSSSSSTAIYYYGLIDVPNPDRKLRISMTAQVSIVLARVHDALIVPSMALGARDARGRYTVRVLDQAGKIGVRHVAIGLNNNVSAQVLSGLRQGEQVIIGQQDATAQAGQSSGPGGPPPMGR